MLYRQSKKFYFNQLITFLAAPDFLSVTKSVQLAELQLRGKRSQIELSCKSSIVYDSRHG